MTLEEFIYYVNDIAKNRKRNQCNKILFECIDYSEDFNAFIIYPY